MFKTSLPFAVALLLLPACFLSRETANEPVRGSKVDTLKPGVSTAADVANLLGAPSEVVQLGTRMAWRYDFTTVKSAGFTIIILTLVNSDTRADRAWLFFDANNVLLFASKSLQAEDASYAMPWQDVHGSK